MDEEGEKGSIYIDEEYLKKWCEEFNIPSQDLSNFVKIFKELRKKNLLKDLDLRRKFPVP